MATDRSAGRLTEAQRLALREVSACSPRPYVGKPNTLGRLADLGLVSRTFVAIPGSGGETGYILTPAGHRALQQGGEDA